MLIITRRNQQTLRLRSRRITVYLLSGAIVALVCTELVEVASASITKTGPGTLVLSGANTYTGPTIVNGGTLKAGVASVPNVSGAFGNNSAVSIANVAGATLEITGFNTQIGSLTGGGTTGGNVVLGAATLTVGGNNTSPAAYSGIISGVGGALTKIGNGTLTVTGANTYSGGTAINGGNLRANNTSGSATGSGDIVINQDGTLSGTGSVAGSVTVNTGGHLAPGASIETLEIGSAGESLSFAAGSHFDYEFNSSVSFSAAADLVNLTGNLSINPAAILNISDLAITDLLIPEGTKFTLISYTGAWDFGTFASRPNNSVVAIGVNAFVLRYDDTTGGLNFGGGPASISYVTLSAVPEASVFLFGILLSSVVALRRGARNPV